MINYLIGQLRQYLFHQDDKSSHMGVHDFETG